MACANEGNVAVGATLRSRLVGEFILIGTVGVLLGDTASGEPTTTTRPHIYITATRFGDGITGASTSVITAEEIARSPGSTLQDILSVQPGIDRKSVV